MPDATTPPAALIRTFRNLVGVPSAHFDPLFAQTVRAAFTLSWPAAVALELPEMVRNEAAWALTGWPTPVASYSDPWFFPFVPGDSILEAYRLAKEAGIEVHLVDLDHDWDDHQRLHALGPDLARLGVPYIETQEALFRAAGQPDDVTLAREAYMARRLAELMDRHEQVLWVGGMYHWSRLVVRLEAGNFDGPPVPAVSERRFERLRLTASALHHMTGRLPRLVSAYARDPDSYDEANATRTMALEALPVSGDGPMVVVSAGAGEDPTWEEPVEGTVADVARTLLYARNLAATEGIRERPDFVELLTAAAACVDAFYAGRLYAIATEEEVSAEAAGLPALSWVVRDGRKGYAAGDRWLPGEPWLATEPGSFGLTISEVQQRIDVLRNLPSAGDGDKKFWDMLPWEEADYGRFIEYILRRATINNPDEATVAPFSAGLQDGVDVRATIRHWYERTIYVREERRTRGRFTNGAIDWVNASEHSDILQGRTRGGWIDPDSKRFGSVTRETRDQDVVMEHPYFMQVDYRDFSMVTLDAPTWIPGQDEESFYTKVIRPLVDLQHTPDDHLYTWLRVMFEFCAGKPFAYYSRYIPSPRIFALASRHDVDLVHIPLQRIPAELLRKHSRFRFLDLTAAQWEEVHRRTAEHGSMWGPAASSAP